MLACGGSVDGDTTKGLHERGYAGKEVYYTLNTPNASARSVHQFALSNVKRLSGKSGSNYVSIYDSSWKLIKRTSVHIETTLEPGKTYYVLVESSDSGGAGTFTLTASCEAPGTSERGTCMASLPSMSRLLTASVSTGRCVQRAVSMPNTLPSSCGAFVV